MINLYKNRQKWIWLSNCLEIDFLSTDWILFVDLKLANYLWVAEKFTGLMFWLVGEIKDWVFVETVVAGFGKLTVLTY